MSYKITNAISSSGVPAWGNKKKYIAVHYLGVVGQAHDLAADGCGAHFYIYWDGTIYQRCSLDAVPWAVGTAGYYKQKHPEANNYNTISIVENAGLMGIPLPAVIANAIDILTQKAEKKGDA